MTDKEDLKPYFLAYAKSSLKKSKNDKSKYYCPLCEKESLSISKKLERFSCFNPSCEWNANKERREKGGDIFDLIEIQTGINDFQDKISYLENYIKKHKLKKDSSLIAGNCKQDQNEEQEFKKLDFESLNRNFLKSEKAIQQIHFRKINDETIKRIKFGFGKSTILKNRNVIFIPFPESDYFIEWNYNSDLNKLSKYLNPKGRDKIPFNYGIIGRTTKPVFICEGVFDSLIIQQSGFEAVAICGSGFSFLLDYIKDHKPKNNLILLFDNDTAGTEFKKQFIEVLKAEKISFFNSNIMEYMTTRIHSKNAIKDPNEAFKIKPEMFISLLKTTESKANEFFIQEQKKNKK